MGSNRKCAYCDSEGQLTREHVFPSFFYSRDAAEGSGKVISPVIQHGKEKFVQSQITISDVCSRCNNGFLSRLDAYGATLFDKFLDRMPRPGDSIKFQYEFDTLSRWLLKLAYNVGRMRKVMWPGFALEILKGATPYIRGGAPRPRNLRLYVQLIVPAKLTPSQKQEILEKDNLNVDEVGPKFRRVSVFAGGGIAAQYLIQINAFIFYPTFWKPNLSNTHIDKKEKKFLPETWGAKWLRPDTLSSVLYPSSLDAVRFIKKHPLMLRNLIRGAEWVP